MYVVFFKKNSKENQTAFEDATLSVYSIIRSRVTHSGGCTICMRAHLLVSPPELRGCPRPHSVEISPAAFSAGARQGPVSNNTAELLGYKRRNWLLFLLFFLFFWVACENTLRYLFVSNEASMYKMFDFLDVVSTFSHLMITFHTYQSIKQTRIICLFLSVDTSIIVTSLAAILLLDVNWKLVFVSALNRSHNITYVLDTGNISSSGRQPNGEIFTCLRL